MSITRDEIANAEVRVADSRQRLFATVDLLRSRLRPAALKRDVANKVKHAGLTAAHRGIDTVKRNPLVAIGVVAAVVAFVARKPIRRLFRRKDPATVKPRKD